MEIQRGLKLILSYFFVNTMLIQNINPQFFNLREVVIFFMTNIQPHSNYPEFFEYQVLFTVILLVLLIVKLQDLFLVS